MIEFIEKIEHMPLNMQIEAARFEAAELGVNYSGELNATELSRAEAAAVVCGVDYMHFIAEEGHHQLTLDEEHFHRLVLIRTRLIDVEQALEQAGFRERISVDELLKWVEPWANSIGYKLPDYLSVDNSESFRPQPFKSNEPAAPQELKPTKGNTKSMDEWVLWRLEQEGGLVEGLPPYGFQRKLIDEATEYGYKDESAVKRSFQRLGLKRTKS